MAEARAAIGTASNVLQFIEFGGKLCIRIKEYSCSATGCSEKLKEVEQHLGHVLTTLESLNDSGRAVLEHERKTLESCLNQAARLDILLQSLRLDTITSRSILRLIHPRILYAAVRSLRQEKKIEEFQQALDRLIELVDLQLQVRNTVVLDHVHNRLRLADEKTEEGWSAPRYLCWIYC